MLNVLNVSRNAETNNRQPVSCEVVETMQETSCMRNIYEFCWGMKSMRKHVVIGPSCLWLLTKAAQRPERIKANSDLKKEILNDWEDTVSKMLHFYMFCFDHKSKNHQNHILHTSRSSEPLTRSWVHNPKMPTRQNFDNFREKILEIFIDVRRYQGVPQKGGTGAVVSIDFLKSKEFDIWE